MSDTVWLAIIAGAFAVIQTLLARKQNKKLEEVKVDLVAANAEVAAVAAETRKEVANKLDVIHTLVNSQVTEFIQREMDATIRSLVSLKELVALKEATGRHPTPATLETIKTTEAAINELNTTLAARAKSQAAATFPAHP